MQKKILALALCALIPVLSIAVANADDYEEYDDVDYEEYEYDYDADEDSGNTDTDTDTADNSKPVDKYIIKDRAVVKRRTCDDIKKELDDLTASGENSVELSNVKAEYRSNCMKKANNRAKGVRVKIVNVASVESVSVNATGADSVKTEGVKSESVNSQSGDAQESLCENNAKPDEHGCCPNETYTDTGDSGFLCCLSDGVTCFRPVQK